MKTIINPTTGRMETIDDDRPKVTPEDVARSRRELRDMLDGSTQFHQDPLAGTKEQTEPLPYIEDDDQHGLCLESGESVPAGKLIYVRTPLPTIFWRKLEVR